MRQGLSPLVLPDQIEQPYMTLGTHPDLVTRLWDELPSQLPADCLMPHMLWERATASTSDVFVPSEKFTSGSGMLNLQPGSYLRLWEWREDKINLIGATQSITVRVRYEKILPLLVLGTDPVQIRRATDASGYCNCGVGCAISRRACAGRRPARLRANRRGNLINRYVCPEQTKGRRRKPYGYRSRIVYL